MTISLASTS